MAKTKALISFAVTAKLICVFVFADANIRFSQVAAQFAFASDFSGVNTKWISRYICTLYLSSSRPCFIIELNCNLFVYRVGSLTTGSKTYQVIGQFL